MRHTCIYSTTTFSMFTPGKLIGKLLPPAPVMSRWCSQGRVDGAAAVKVLVIPGSICAGNLKDRSAVALLALAGSAACQNTHGKDLRAPTRCWPLLCCIRNVAYVRWTASHLTGNSTFSQAAGLYLAGLQRRILPGKDVAKAAADVSPTAV